MSPFIVLALGLLCINITTVIAVKLKIVLTYHLLCIFAACCIFPAGAQTLPDWLWCQPHNLSYGFMLREFVHNETQMHSKLNGLIFVFQHSVYMCVCTHACMHAHIYM